MIQSLTFIDKILGRFFKRIKSSTYLSTQQLGLFRLLYGTLLLFYFLPSWTYLNEVPPGLFRPKLISFANLTNDFLPEIIFILSDIFAVILLLFITIGFFTRISLVLMFVLSAILYSYSFSLGKIDHYTNLFLFTYLVLAFTNCGTVYSIKKDKNLNTYIQNSSLTIMGVMIAFGFFTGGFAKCLFWMDFDVNTSGFFDWFYGGYFNSQQVKIISQYVFKVPNHWFEIVEYIIPIFEIIGFLFLLKSKRSWILYLVMASGFHLLNHFILNLNFTLNTLSYGMFFIPPVLLFIKNKYNLRPLFKAFVFICIFYAIFRIVLIMLNRHLFNFHDYGSHFVFEFIVNTILWLGTIVCGVLVLKKRIPL